jgi:hypothetical protein
VNRALFAAALVVVVVVPSGYGRTRAVKHPCKSPTVTLTSSSTAVCPNESVRLFWNASDPSAVVAVDGVGANLPSSGSAVVPISQATTFTATAKSACGGGSRAASVAVDLRPQPSGSIAAPTSTSQGLNVSIFISTLNAASWSLTSSIGNGLDPGSGSGTGDFSSTYHANVSGTDTVQLKVNGLCGSTSTFQSYYHTISISPYTPTPTPTPQPSGYLRCCDNTFSPTCNSCANKQGCCSHHGGVCSC